MVLPYFSVYFPVTCAGPAAPPLRLTHPSSTMAPRQISIPLMWFSSWLRELLRGLRGHNLCFVFLVQLTIGLHRLGTPIHP